VGFVAALASVSVGSVGTRISGAFSAAAEKVVAASATAAAGVIEAGKEALFYLTGSTLSPVDNATALSVDFSSLNFLHVENITPADLTWSVGNSPLPPGLTLDPALGVLSGAIPTKGSYEFEIVASRDSEESRATYSIDVNGVRLAVTAVSTSRNNSCAILAADGSVVCWGDGSSGKLGDGRTVASAVPVAVIGLGPGVQQISAGVFHTCAIDAAGAAKCWGSGTEGRLGNGSTSDSSTPVQVSGLTSGVRSIAAGAVHTCAIDADGAAKCWGWGEFGQRGDGKTTPAVSLPTDVLVPAGG